MSEAAAPDSASARLEAWRQKLLDLTRRNRLLNYRPYRRTTIEVVDEHPAAVWRLLTEGRALGFLPREQAPPDAGPPPAEPGGAAAESAGDDPAAGAPSKAPLEPALETDPASTPAPAPPAGGLALKVAGSPTRCPYCHESIAPDEPEQQVCAACLTRHHPECWNDLGQGSCGNCRGRELLVRGEAPAPPPGTLPEGPAPWRPFEPEQAPERHQDDRLQTPLVQGELELNLLAISRRAGETLEEQGFNALYLALGFLEFQDPHHRELQRAPLLLVPVQLGRRRLTSPFRVARSDDEPLLNPALAYKLNRELKLELPELPDDLESFDPDALFQTIQAEIEGIEGWRILSSISLGLFSFTKLAMYRDLERHQETLLGHRLIRRLLGAPLPPAADDPTSAATGDSPPAQSPRTFAVFDADGSQREAIDAALAGRDLVLEGPPGTGKSQTIANVIAEFLGRGKSVLFVSEKMAALQVVHGRLGDAGLGDACLQLHSKEANKRAVIRELERTLDAEPPRDHAEDEVLDQAACLSSELDEHVGALHDPWQPAGLSPYRILSALEEVRHLDLPLTPGCLSGVAGWSRADLETAERTLELLARRVERVGPVAEHACRGLGLSSLSHEREEQLLVALRELEAAASLADRAALELSEISGLPRAVRLLAVDEVLALAELLCAPELPEPQLLGSPYWDERAALGPQLIALRKEDQAARAKVLERFREEAYHHDETAALAEAVDGYAKTWWLFRVLSPGYYAARRQVRELLPEVEDGESPELPELEVVVRDLLQLAKAQRLAEKVQAGGEDGRIVFGQAWDGADPGRLEQVLELVGRVRREVRRGRVPPEVLDRLDDRERIGQARGGLADARQRLRAAWLAFKEAGEFDAERGLGGALHQVTLETLAKRASALREAQGEWRAWAELQAAQAEARQRGVERFALEALEQGGVPPGELPPALRREVLLRWLDAVEAERGPLARFDSGQHQRRIEDFRRLDRRRLLLARVRLRHDLARRKPDAQWQASQDSELGLLRREIRRQRGHLPIRQLFRRAPQALLALKPCLFMSPLTVALYTDPTLHRFDLVIFDEASQIAPEDALGALARGKQAVIVGDRRQLPPTAFFQLEANPNGGETSLGPDLESVLDESVAQGLERKLLRWHYRSRHESLIAFSNHHFYGDRLCTFPSPDDGGGRLGLRHVLVERGVYDRGGSGTNFVEAEVLAEAVVQHLRESPDKSLGVGTFSQAQQEEVQNAIERQVLADPELEALLDPERDEHLFVKNLENLQGDERDVIFVSVGYGPDAERKLSLNFGPLNRAGGERRLNVLVTRAREQLKIFTSFPPEQLEASRSQSEGIRLLRRYLDFAAGRSQGPPLPTDALPPLERATLAETIARELSSRGLELVRDVGSSAVKLDLAVAAPAVHVPSAEELEQELSRTGLALEPGNQAEPEPAAEGDETAATRVADERPGDKTQTAPPEVLTAAKAPPTERDAFALGVLLDGPHYAGFPVTRDRERIVPDVLRAQGWSLARVWALEWHRDRERVVQGLLEQAAQARQEYKDARLEAARADAVAAKRRRDRATAKKDPIKLKEALEAEPRTSTAVPYRELMVEQRGNSQELRDVAGDVMEAVVQAIVSCEGPIHLHELERRALAHWQSSRSSSYGREAVQEAARRIAERGQLERRGEFWWPEGYELVPRDRTEEGPRDAALIPPEELGLALSTVVSKEWRVPRAALIKRAARLLGFTRAGKKLQAALDGALEAALADNSLEEEAGVVRLPGS